MDEGRRGPNPLLVGGLAGCGVVLVFGILGFLGLMMIMGRSRVEVAMLQEECAMLEAEREEMRHQVAAEQERTYAMIEELERTRELVNGRGFDELEPDHYQATVLRPMSRRLDELLARPEVVEALEQRGARRELVDLEQMASGGFDNLIDVCRASEALARVVEALAQDTPDPQAEAAERELKETVLRSRKEIDALRTQLNMLQDEVLVALRDFDRARRGLQEVQEAGSLDEARKRASETLDRFKQR